MTQTFSQLKHISVSIQAHRSKGIALACLLVITLSGMSSHALAEQNKQKPPTYNPIGSGWSASKVDKNINPGEPLTPEQQTLIAEINGYFNQLTNLKGHFRQTNPDLSIEKGKFYVKRPGRIRFDYSPPSSQRIMSDGKYLSVEDLDLKTVDRYPLSSTPFRILLTRNVDLLRDAHILAIGGNEDAVTVRLIDKSEKAAGEIQLFFQKRPVFQLSEWKITDSQGLITRTIVWNLNTDQEIDSSLFQFEDLSNPFFPQ